MLDRFVGVDWGTSSLRIWLMDGGGRVFDRRSSNEGMSRCNSPSDFRNALDRHIGAMGCGTDVPIIACGMVGARQGWIEAPYLDVGVPLDRLPTQAVRAPHPDLNVLILPGVAQKDPATPDVMRGEETLIFGMLEGTPCLIGQPGTHGKWIEVDGRAITRFSTHMTGELFDLLSTRSTLAHLIEQEAVIDPKSAEFVKAVRLAIDDPAILRRLFSLRAGGLLGMRSPAAAAATLSGLLIGAEIAPLVSDRRQVHLLATGKAAELYGAALAEADVAFVSEDAEALTRRGLLKAARLCDWTRT